MWLEIRRFWKNIGPENQIKYLTIWAAIVLFLLFFS